MFLLNGQPLQIDTPFTHNGFQYPANWLRLSTPEEKEAIGIDEVAEAVRADDRFYWDGDINMPKDLNQLKAQFVAEAKRTAGLLLAESDWYVVRKADIGTDIPADVVAYRAVVRAKVDELETDINAVESVSDLATMDMSFPSKV